MKKKYTYIEEVYEEIEIEEILQVSESKDFIDISVDEDETFCITNERIISHNCKSMMRAITHAAAKSNCPIVFSNHIYDDPSQLHPTKVKKQAGGSGPLYMSSVLIQLSKRTEKTNDSKNKDANDESVVSADVNGLTLRAYTTKNRFVPPFLETEMYLNFKTGLNPRSGLLEMAENNGVLVKQGHRYDINGDLMYFKDFKDRDDIWNDFIIPKLELKLQETLKFNSAQQKICEE